MGCYGGNYTNVTCYESSNNLTGLSEMFNYVKNQTSIDYPGTSSSLIYGGDIVFGLMLMLPLFIILFSYMAKNTGDTYVAFTGTSFVCWIITIPLIAMSYAPAGTFMFFMALTAVSGALTIFRNG